MLRDDLMLRLRISGTRKACWLTLCVGSIWRTIKALAIVLAFTERLGHDG